MKFDLEDTIAAIATAPGEAGIGIVRISGPASLTIADKVFRPRSARMPSHCKGFSVHYGWIVGGGEKKKIDEALLTVMRGPKSYTREDVVEISCHGGTVALRAVLDLALEGGCRLAHPGEFTKRAFLNGRIDLSQAEAVLDIIRAKTDSALKIGIQQLQGVLSRELHKIRGTLLGILAQFEASIDFPEEEPSQVNPDEALPVLKALQKKLGAILEEAAYGRLYREGISTVICGRPNVGKSSLLNALLKQERSIVTPLAGTTRDTIEEIIDIKGIPIRIVDTAGIVEPKDLVERKAVQRTKRYIDTADLAILVFDGSRHLSSADNLLTEKLLKKNKAVIAVINKMDLKQKIERSRILKKIDSVISLSAKKIKNIDTLEEAIVSLVHKGKICIPESILTSNMRHIQGLRAVQRHIHEAVVSLQEKLSLEFVAHHIKDALGRLDEISGAKFSEDLLDTIFSEFCIGK